MRIENRYGVDASEELIDLLEENRIQYKLSNVSKPPRLYFYLFEDDPHRIGIERLCAGSLIIPSLVFEKSEYEQAQWYRFMPKYDKVPSCESELTYSYFCRRKDGTRDYDTIHLHQIGPYRLNKKPKWPCENCILSSVGNYDHEWFTNESTRNLLECSNVHGLRFDPVMRDRDGTPLEDIYQIRFNYELPEEALVIGKENGIRSIIICDNCGEKRYNVSPYTYQICLYNKYLGEQDIYVTQAVFGQGYGHQIVVASKKFYQTIKDNNMERFFKIHPAIIV